MAVAPARLVALKLVGECRRRSARMRDLLRTSKDLDALDARDRALAFRLAMGVAATQGLLDQMIDAHLRKPRSVEPKVRDALRVAAFELLWMQTPLQVVVSQGVELVRCGSPRAAGLANAVLRRIAEQDRARLDDARLRIEAKTASLEDLALVSAVPMWLASELESSRGLEAAQAMLGRRLDAPQTMVGANLARHTVRETAELLMDAGLEPAPSALPRAFELSSPAGLAPSGLIAKGRVVVADAAAQIVCQLVGPSPKSHALEIGQGRATKTILLESSALAHGGLCQMASVDSEEFKVRLARERVRKAGLADSVSCVCLDGRRLASANLPEPLNQAFELVFLDAPCSGVGTMRRHVEIPWALDAKAVDPGHKDSLPALQLELLKASSARVREGGTLCYSTCSALVQEDEAVVRAFLGSPEGREFRLVNALSRLGSSTDDKALAKLVEPWVTGEGYLLTGLSDRGIGLVDTHFLAVMERGA